MTSYPLDRLNLEATIVRSMVFNNSETCNCALQTHTNGRTHARSYTHTQTHACLSVYIKMSYYTTHNSVTTRGHAFKLKTRSFRLDVARNHFCNRVVPLWNSLPVHVVNKPSPLLFKAALRHIDFTCAVQFTRNL